MVRTIELDRRLTDVGERIRFTLTGDASMSSDMDFAIFPRYLEECDPDQARRSCVPLAWLDGNPSIPLEPTFHDCYAELEYTPERPGNYIARVRFGEKTFYRYFAAVDEQYLVYRMEGYGTLRLKEHVAGMRNGGFPIDWVIPTDEDRLQPALEHGNGDLEQLLVYQDVFADLLMPGFYGAKSLVENQGIRALREHLGDVVERMRKAGIRVDRAVNDWTALPSAVEEYARAGFDVVDGIIPEGETHRGAPWFPYWMADREFLSPAEGPSQTLGMIMDFCAGFHFHGPPDFHMAASMCNWQIAAPHADLAAREHVLIAENSGSGPVFVPTLFVFGYPKWTQQWPDSDWTQGQEIEFCQSFLDDTAFEHARKYPIVFARCTDIADYMRRHPEPQPRRILSSVTRDWRYDRFWSPEWCNLGVDAYRDVLPFNDSLEDIRARRPAVWAKPTSRELIYYEDSVHQCRFEYACPKPMLWYSYDDHRRTAEFGSRPETDVPDPEITMETRIDQAGFDVRYRIQNGREFPNYKLAVWHIPREFAQCSPQTNASEFVRVRNSEDDYRGILVFDLKPEMEVRLLFTTEDNHALPVGGGEDSTLIFR